LAFYGVMVKKPDNANKVCLWVRLVPLASPVRLARGEPSNPSIGDQCGHDTPLGNFAAMHEAACEYTC
jgi:hypothetical protein